MEDIFHEEFLLEKDENISDTEYDLKQLLLEANLKVKKVSLWFIKLSAKTT